MLFENLSRGVFRDVVPRSCVSCCCLAHNVFSSTNMPASTSSPKETTATLLSVHLCALCEWYT